METIRKSADAAVVEGSSPVSSSAALVSYQQAAAASVRERLPEVTRVLQAANVTKVGIVYDGPGIPVRSRRCSMTTRRVIDSCRISKARPKMNSCSSSTIFSK